MKIYNVKIKTMADDRVIENGGFKSKTENSQRYARDAPRKRKATISTAAAVCFYRALSTLILIWVLLKTE